MRKEKLSKKVVTGILATALCATAFTGCGKKAADGMTVLEEKVPQQADSGIYKQANLEGITKEGEYLEFFDYESGRVIAVAHGQDGKRRCVSFKPDGSDIKSFDIAGDGNSMSALFTADKVLLTPAKMTEALRLAVRARMMMQASEIQHLQPKKAQKIFLTR